MTNPFLQQSPIKGIKKIIAVGSGKGGVGKSTVSVNLALALKKEGLNVGLLDADIYGPSIPRLMGALNQKVEINPQGKMAPVKRSGLSLMSIGFVVEEGSAVVWRGPMLFKAMDQFFRDTEWGELDVLLVDLPPGTGDIALTMAQKVPVNGAIVVCTPQNLALADAKKAFDMFDKVNVPILGAIENMAYLERNGEKIQLFPRGELNQYLDVKKIQKLGVIPFDPSIGMASEAGIPYVDSQDGENSVFIEIAQNIKKQLEL
jgi:ATP-binding protein involved in chromosome partitioning